MAKQMNEPQPQRSEHQTSENTDRELWREREGDYYADSIHVTKGGGIGINCGGYVYVKPLREWHRLATEQPPATEEWTVEGRFICRSHGAMGKFTVGAAASEEDASKLISAHNAALAEVNAWAEYERTENAKLREQLAKEGEAK
jgi:hypothetical protein